jgi:transposase
LLTHVLLRAVEFAVAPEYDFTRSTSAQYRHSDYKVNTDPSRDGGKSTIKKWSPSSHGEVYGPLRSIRQRLDYSYHVNYSKKRQLWQDQLISVRQIRKQSLWQILPRKYDEKDGLAP